MQAFVRIGNKSMLGTEGLDTEPYRVWDYLVLSGAEGQREILYVNVHTQDKLSADFPKTKNLF